MEESRCVTFDCYGTLVDWNAGVRAEPSPTREQPDLRGLADVLDELVPR
jgi:FMN phosphatase YigB (HAD superfamily)